MTDLTYERPYVKLVGEDGNAFAVMARASMAMRKAGATEAECKEYLTKAMSEDYDNLLRVTLEYVKEDY